MVTRQYDFIVGPETSTLPTIGVPSSGTDLVSWDFVETTTGTKASPTAITAGGGITAATDTINEFQYVEGSGGAINITANPQISAPNKTSAKITIIGTSNTNTVTFEHGDGLVMNGPITLGEDDTITFIYNETNWVEISRTEV